MKIGKNKLVLICILSLIPSVITAAVFNKLPEQIPMHWDINGNIDSWYPKFPGAFLLPGITILAAFLFMVLPNLDPKKENYEKFKKSYFIIQIFMIAFFTVLQIVIISVSLGSEFISVDFIVKFMIGIMFIIFGYLMPNLKHNYFLGIKTPWTYASEEVWNMSHKHGGYIWFIAGFILCALAFVQAGISAAIYFSLIMIAAFEPIVYSYIAFRNLKNVKTDKN